MEFLDINLTLDSSHFLHALQSFYLQIFKENKTLPVLCFENTYKKSAKQENLSLFVNIIL
jgi:hypothetical protein